MQFDWALLLIVGALIMLGLMMVYSASFDWSFVRYDDPTLAFRAHLRNTAVGLVLLWSFARFGDYRWFQIRTLAIALFIGTGIALAAVLSLNIVKFGASRTLTAEGSLQPSELAKLITVIYLAVWLNSKREQLRNWSFGIIPYVILVGGMAGLIFTQPDVSTGITVLVVSTVMLFLAEVDWSRLIVLFILAAAFAIIIVTFSTTAQVRIENFWQTITDLTSQAVDWQTQQGVIAFINGGWIGRGLGQSYQKMSFALPTPDTDSIFAVLGEEMGFAGTMLLLGLYTALVWRGAKIALQAETFLGSLLAGGITCWIAIEILINVCVMVGLLPVAGNALPFISRGGSAMVVLLLACGILLNISRRDLDTTRPEKITRAATHRSGRNWRSRLPRVGGSTGTDAT